MSKDIQIKRLLNKAVGYFPIQGDIEYRVTPYALDKDFSLIAEGKDLCDAYVPTNHSTMASLYSNDTPLVKFLEKTKNCTVYPSNLVLSDHTTRCTTRILKYISSAVCDCGYDEGRIYSAVARTISSLSVKQLADYDGCAGTLAIIQDNLKKDPHYYSARSVGEVPDNRRLVRLAKKQNRLGANDYSVNAFSFILVDGIIDGTLSVAYPASAVPMLSFPVAGIVILGALQGLRVWGMKKDKGVKQQLVPLNYVNALNLLRLKKVCNEITAVSKLIPADLNVLDFSMLDEALLSGEILLAKRQRIIDAALLLQEESTTGASKDALNAAVDAVALLEDEWIDLYEKLVDFHDVSDKLSKHTKAAVLRDSLYAEIDGITLAAAGASASSEMLEQSRIAQQSLLDAISSMQQSGILL